MPAPDVNVANPASGPVLAVNVNEMGRIPYQSMKTNTVLGDNHQLLCVFNTVDTICNWQGSSSGAVIQTVTAVKVTTTTALSSDNNPSGDGQPVTFRAQVTPVSGTGVPTGTVNFVDGNALLGTADLVSGTASFTTSSLAVGMHAIVGSYLGDTNFSVSNSSVLTQTVSSSGGGKITPKVGLTVNGSSTGATVFVGDTVSFVARIQAAAGYPWPTGSITISDSTNASEESEIKPLAQRLY